MSFHNSNTKETEIAEYQQTGEMARHHASYRFTMFGFFVTIMIALNGSVFWLEVENNATLIALMTCVLASVVAWAAYRIDDRTMNLYYTCETHARDIEKNWRAPASEGESALLKGVCEKLNSIETKRYDRHSFWINFLYFTSVISCWMLIIINELWDLAIAIYVKFLRVLNGLF